MTGTVTRPTTDGNIERFILNKPGTFASTSIECFSFAHQNLPLCSSARRKERIPWDPVVSSAFRRIRHADGRIRLPLSSVGGGGGDGQSGSDGQVIMGGVLGSGGCRVFSAPTNTSHSDLDLRGQVPSLDFGAQHLGPVGRTGNGLPQRRPRRLDDTPRDCRSSSSCSLSTTTDDQLHVARPSSLYDIFYH